MRATRSVCVVVDDANEIEQLLVNIREIVDHIEYDNIM